MYIPTLKHIQNTRIHTYGHVTRDIKDVLLNSIKLTIVICIKKEEKKKEKKTKLKVAGL